MFDSYRTFNQCGICDAIHAKQWGGYQIRESGSQWGSRAKPRWGKSPEAEAFLLILNNFFKPCHLNLFIGFGDVLVSLKIVYL